MTSHLISGVLFDFDYFLCIKLADICNFSKMYKQYVLVSQFSCNLEKCTSLHFLGQPVDCSALHKRSLRKLHRKNVYQTGKWQNHVQQLAPQIDRVVELVFIDVLFVKSDKNSG